MIHLKKLCVGVDSAEQLRRGQMGRGQLEHCTRNFPRRAREIVGVGSLYWIIRGSFALRQKIVALEAFTSGDNRRFCRIVFDPVLISVRADPHRPFQGWRYLELENAPPDTHIDETGAVVPDDLSFSLDQLGIRAATNQEPIRRLQ